MLCSKSLVFNQKNYRLIDWPCFYPLEEYQRLCSKISDLFASLPQVVALWQLGEVKAPGISDLDFLVVVKTGRELLFPKQAFSSPAEKYLLAHGVFVCEETSWPELLRYTFFHYSRKMLGQSQPFSEPVAPAEKRLLQRQFAWEYLLKLYFDLVISHCYGIVKVRSWLLHMRAVAYDLQLLEVEDSPLSELVDTVIAWREQWFTAPPSKGEICHAFYQSCCLIEQLLNKLFTEQKLFLPLSSSLALRSPITIIPSSHLGVVHQGWVLPSWLATSKRYYNLQHRCNRFFFSFPWQSSADVAILQQQWRCYQRQMVKNYGAGLAPLLPPLSLQIISAQQECQ